MVERLLVFALVEVVFAHLKMSLIGDGGAGIVADHGIEHGKTPFILLVINEFQGFVEEVLGLSTDLTAVDPGSARVTRLLRGRLQEKEAAQEETDDERTNVSPTQSVVEGG